MLKIQYFASVREAMARSEDALDPPASVHTVADLMQFMAAQDDKFAALAAAENPLLVAVNQSVVDRSAPLTDNDEVAFFPPMTGG